MKRLLHVLCHIKHVLTTDEQKLHVRSKAQYEQFIMSCQFYYEMAVIYALYAI